MEYQFPYGIVKVKVVRYQFQKHQYLRDGEHEPFVEFVLDVVLFYVPEHAPDGLVGLHPVLQADQKVLDHGDGGLGDLDVKIGGLDLQQKSGLLIKSHAAIFWLDISFLNSSIVLYPRVECILLLLYQVSIHWNMESSA